MVDNYKYLWHNLFMIENNNDKILSKVFKAISDVTRRTLLTQLVQEGSSRVTDLAKFYKMSLNAISKHLKVLEKADLIIRNKIGRVHWIEANLKQIEPIEHWLDKLKSIWEFRLDKLEEIIKGNNMNTTSVNLKKIINAPLETVFNAWLNPNTIANFMMPMDGMKTPSVKIDASVEGEFSIIMHLDGNELPHTGKYIEINYYSKLVFTWKSPFSPKESIVTLEFIKLSNEKTQIELTHAKFIDEESRKNHEKGWLGILNALEKLYE